MAGSRQPICTICFEAVPNLLRLKCSHSLCAGCASHADAHGHMKCPVCRLPHVLDRRELRARLTHHRAAYRDWRVGAARGAVGELKDISRPREAAHKDKTVLHALAGDLISSAGVVEEAPPASVETTEPAVVEPRTWTPYYCARDDARAGSSASSVDPATTRQRCSDAPRCRLFTPKHSLTYKQG